MSSLPSKTVMLIDDSAALLDAAGSALVVEGYRVVVHQGAAGCVSRILLERPDLVLIDVRTQELTSETIVKLFTDAHPHSNATILLYSSLPAAVLEDRVRSSGARGFVRKTANLNEMVRSVGNWLQAGRFQSGSSQPAIATSGLYPTKANPNPGSGPTPVLTDSVPPEPFSASSLSLPVHRHTPGYRPTVLFVDDDMATLSAFRRMFQNDEFISEFALSGAQALRRIKSANPPDVLVCDMLMPDTSGRSVYAQARALDPDWETRAVFVTGEPMHSPKVRQLFEDFRGPILTKPFQEAALRDAIRACLRHSGARDTEAHALG